MNTLYHELVVMPNQNFPVNIFHRNTNRNSVGCEFHWHEQIELYYVERGGIQLLCNGEKLWVHSNDIAIINCNEPHRSIQFMDDTLHYCIQFDLRLLSSGTWDICQEKYRIPLVNSEVSFHKLIPQNDTFVSIIKSIIMEYQTHTFGYELAIKSDMMKLFSYLLRNYSLKEIQTINILANSTELSHVRKLTNYISENLNQMITLQDLALICDLSIPYLCRIFKKYTGSTIIEYINLLRCQRALSLLAVGYNITDAALSVGFNDSNYFSRTFKKLYGTSPTKYCVNNK